MQRVKRWICLMLCLCLVVTVTAVFSLRVKNGDIPVRLGDSELYSEAEIMKAVNVVKTKFKQSDTLTLLQIKYDEAYTLREMKSRKEHYGEEKVIVLLADIYVGMDALAVGSFVPGCTSTDYQFILTQNSFGRWTIQDCGYA